MKILGRISLILSVFTLSFVVFTQIAFAQNVPVCADFQPTQNCICDANRYEQNNTCFPANINGCDFIDGTCQCAVAGSTVNMVVGDAVCNSYLGGTDPGTTPATGAKAALGSLKAPPGVNKFNSQVTGTGEKIGIIIFASNLIRIATIVAGLIVFMNFIWAGYAYLTSDGSSKVHEQVRGQLTYSVIGLVIIVASYTIIAIISLLLFGKADFILNPTLPGPTP